MANIPRASVGSYHVPGPQGPAGPAGPQGVPGAPASDDLNVFNVQNYASPAAAAALANSSRGTLFFPPGTYDLGGEPIEITGAGVRVVGCGDDSRLNFSGPAAIRVTNGAHVSIESLQVRGTNASGQNGIELVASSLRCAVKNCYIESVALGRGIYAQLALSLHLDANRIGGCQDAIAINGPCGCLIERNLSNYWADHGIFLYSENDDIGPRVNRVAQNVLHGNGGTAQDVSGLRAGIRIRRVSSTLVECNYIERVELGDGDELGHGIWIDGTDSSLTQANEVRRNYFGPGTTGDLILINGIASHTQVSGNNIPTGKTLRDDGLYTQFLMQHLGAIEQLVGTSTTRAGWIGLGPTGAVQLHV